MMQRPTFIVVFGVAISMLAACENRDSNSNGNGFVPDTRSDETSSDVPATSDTQATVDVPVVPDDGPQPPVDPYPEDWTDAPTGFCDDESHLAVVKWVVDGDTIELNGDDRVRFIGVDAPEIYKNDCFSNEAKVQLADLSGVGAVVCLLADSNSSSLDPYDRLLRYVFVRHLGRWVMVNDRMVRVGAARAYHLFLPGKDYRKQLEVAEEEAFADHAGGWSACGW